MTDGVETPNTIRLYKSMLTDNWIANRPGTKEALNVVFMEPHSFRKGTNQDRPVLDGTYTFVGPAGTGDHPITNRLLPEYNLEIKDGFLKSVKNSDDGKSLHSLEIPFDHMINHYIMVFKEFANHDIQLTPIM